MCTAAIVTRARVSDGFGPLKVTDQVDAAIKTTLVPTPAGARYAVRSAEREPQRATLMGLLRGGGRTPVALPTLTAWTGLTDKKSLLGLLFKMQRDGLVSAGATPLSFAAQPLGEALAPLLRALSSQERALLADDAGFCVTSTGYERRAADALAAVAAEASRFHASCARNAEGGTLAGPWVSMSDGEGGAIGVAPLHIADHLFHVVVAGTANMESDAFVQLIAELMRYCLGDAANDEATRN